MFDSGIVDKGGVRSADIPILLLIPITRQVHVYCSLHRFEVVQDAKTLKKYCVYVSRGPTCCT